jgi:nucleotide-binding universal stress UspA family protein
VEVQTNDVIRTIARQEHADLIALGTHGLGGFRKWLLGSTTEQLLRGTPIPVLAVPLIDALETAAEHRAPPVQIERILAATDFSVPGNDAVTCAVDLTRAEGASLLIAHVVSPVAVAPRWRSYVGDVDEENASRARARLEDLSRRLFSESASHVPIELVVRVGRPADGIAEIAQQHHSHVIVLGIVGENRDLAHRPGSIAYRVLCQARVPVLVVPPGGHPA